MDTDELKLSEENKLFIKGLMSTNQVVVDDLVSTEEITFVAETTVKEAGSIISEEVVVLKKMTNHERVVASRAAKAGLTIEEYKALVAANDDQIQVWFAG